MKSAFFYAHTPTILKKYLKSVFFRKLFFTFKKLIQPGIFLSNSVIPLLFQFFLKENEVKNRKKKIGRSILMVFLKPPLKNFAYI